MRQATRILLKCGRGDDSDFSRLLSLVYDELRALAAHYLRQERSGHTLQPTALVHEAFLRLVDREDIQQADCEQFMRIAAQAMRRVLIDHARSCKAGKRGGGVWKQITLDKATAPSGCGMVDLVALNDSLDRLKEKDQRLVDVVELRFFAGLSIDETARVLGVSDRTIDNDWYVARAWLARELGEGSRV